MPVPTLTRADHGRSSRPSAVGSPRPPGPWPPRRLRHLVAFAGRQEQVRLDAVLPRVHLVVAAARARSSSACVPRSTMRPVLDHQDLVGAADGGQAVRDDERGAAAHQVRRGPPGSAPRTRSRGWTSPRPGSGCAGRPGSRARSRRAGAARPRASRRARPRSCRSPSGNASANSSTRAIRQAARISSSVASGREKRDVLADGAVEEERLLQHDAELRAVGVEAHGREVHAVHQDAARRRRVERGDQADDRGLARARRAHQRRHRARLAPGTRRRAAPACRPRRRSATSSNATSPSMRPQRHRAAAGPRPPGARAAPRACARGPPAPR